MEHIEISGQILKLKELQSEETHDLWLGLLADFTLYHFAMNDKQMLLLVSHDNNRYTPLQLKKVSERIEGILGEPSVFYYDSLSTNERDRLFAQGVYFVVSTKFAFVPTLLANRRMSKANMPSMLLPSTQYMLLFHLQCESLDGKSLKDMEKLLPFKYATLSKSALQLSALKLAEFNATEGRTKQLHFTLDAKSLWEESQKYLSSPVKAVVYSSKSCEVGVIGCYSALSHYTLLAGEDVPSRVFTQNEFQGLGQRTSSFEDIQRIEIWKYPPLSTTGFVDKLSLYLSLRGDNDPRVEKELETMINNIQW